MSSHACNCSIRSPITTFEAEVDHVSDFSSVFFESQPTPQTHTDTHTTHTRIGHCLNWEMRRSCLAP